MRHVGNLGLQLRIVRVAADYDEAQVFSAGYVASSLANAREIIHILSQRGYRP